MMKNPRNLLIFAFLGGIVGTGFGLILGQLGDASSPNKSAESDIRTMLDRQVAAWNSGNVEAYMNDYIRGDSLRFASGGNIEMGWQPTLERYQRRYPDRSTMGTLVAENLDVQVIDADDALVFGTWELIRENDKPSGLYTLHVKKIDGTWVIVSDHTSSAE